MSHCLKNLLHYQTLTKFSLMKPWREIVSHYHQTKRAAALSIDSTILPPTFKALSFLNSSPKLGMSLHADIIKLGFDSSVSTSNSVISFCMKSSMPDSALTLFDGMATSKDSVSWNALIHGFLALGHHNSGLGFFKEAKTHIFVPNISTLVLVLHSCWRLGAVHEGRNIHGFITKSGFVEFAEVQNSLLSFYVKCHDLAAARELFDEMRKRDVIAYSVLISGYARSGDDAYSIELFRSMCIEDDGVDVDGLAMVGLLQACSVAENINLGRSVHAHVIRRGFGADLFVGNSLVDMYSKCRDVDSAISAFSAIRLTNVVSWNSVLSALVRNEMFPEVFRWFGSMREAGVDTDEVTIVNILQACKRLNMGLWCKCIHTVVLRKFSEFNEFVLNSLLDAYAKCDLTELAVRLFERSEIRDVFSWSTMIAGFAHCGRPDEAIVCFREMRMANEMPNSVTMLSLLEACTVSAELPVSKSAHGLVIRNCFSDELVVGTAIVDMYAKCGDLLSSTRAFGMMPAKNILSWNAMIGGLGMNGRAKEALALLRDMEVRNVKPNEVTMLSVLSACSHGGLVEEGLSCFRRMTRDPLLRPGLEHYSCVVDMLGRAGDLDGALNVIESMPKGVEAGKAAWSALLSACRSHGNLELGQLAASRVLELEPRNSAGYLLTSSIYAKGGSTEKMANMRWLIREGRLRLESGYSSVNVEQRSHKFFSWDGSHPQCEEIYCMVEHLHDCIRFGKRDSSSPFSYSKLSVLV